MEWVKCEKCNQEDQWIFDGKWKDRQDYHKYPRLDPQGNYFTGVRFTKFGIGHWQTFKEVFSVVIDLIQQCYDDTEVWDDLTEPQIFENYVIRCNCGNEIHKLNQ